MLKNEQDRDSERQKYKHIDSWKNKWTEIKTDGHILTQTQRERVNERGRERERQTDRGRKRQTEAERERQRHGLTKIKKDRKKGKRT